MTKCNCWYADNGQISLWLFKAINWIIFLCRSSSLGHETISGDNSHTALAAKIRGKMSIPLPQFLTRQCTVLDWQYRNGGFYSPTGPHRLLEGEVVLSGPQALPGRLPESLSWRMSSGCGCQQHTPSEQPMGRRYKQSNEYFWLVTVGHFVYTSDCDW